MKRTIKLLPLMAVLTLTVPAAPVRAEAPAEGQLRTAVLYDISTMDVARTTDDYMIPMNVFDRLFETRVVEGVPQVVGSLCTDYSVSPDGLTYDFTLREGVVFSNGSPLTASDVRYTFERLLKINDQNTDIPMEVAGSRALVSGEAEALSGFLVTDDTHFSITLSAPNAGFTAELSAAAMSIVDAETTSAAPAFGTDPADTIGTGPYRVTEWVTNDHYTLEYNDRYWGPAPDVKHVLVRVIPDAGTQSLMFQNGELDILDLQNVDTAIVESLYKPLYADRIVSTPKVGLTYLALNENQKYLKDVRVRKAIGMALNVQELIEDLYYGNAIRENGIIPTGIWGHNDALEGFAYDPEGAKALLKEAGYGEGEVRFEIAMDSSSTSVIQLVNHSLSQMLEKAGIIATVVTYDHASWLAKRTAGEVESFVARWGMDYNDPANIMFTFFGGPAQTAERSLNYPDLEVMARVAAASAIVEDEARRAEYQALEKRIISVDAAWIPLYEDLHLYCLGSRVHSFTPQWAGFSDYYAADVSLR